MFSINDNVLFHHMKHDVNDSCIKRDWNYFLNVCGQLSTPFERLCSSFRCRRCLKTIIIIIFRAEAASFDAQRHTQLQRQQQANVREMKERTEVSTHYSLILSLWEINNFFNGKLYEWSVQHGCTGSPELGIILGGSREIDQGSCGSGAELELAKVERSNCVVIGTGKLHVC